MSLLSLTDGRTRHESEQETTVYLQRLVDRLPKEWDRSKFVLCGSAAMAVRGIRGVNDLDVLVLPELMPAVKLAFPDSVGCANDDEDEDYPAELEGVTKDIQVLDSVPTTYVPVGLPRTELWRVKDIDFFDGLLRPVASNKQVFAEAGYWNGYLVMSLRHCIAVKALGWRYKDKRDMVLSLVEDLDKDTSELLFKKLLPNAKKEDIQKLATTINEMNAQWIV